MPPTSSAKPLESFIPLRRSELIELCLADRQLDERAGLQFREFCEILAAFYHFRAHAQLERLKEHYAPFDPDAETRPMQRPSAEELPRLATSVASEFSRLLTMANYRPLSQQELEQAFEVVSLIPLHTKVDLDDYDQVLFFYRGPT